MECEKGAMSFTSTKELISSPINSLGAGDISFQNTLGIHAHKLPFSGSPAQISRQRTPYSIVNHYGAEKAHLEKNKIKTIHMSLEDLSDPRKRRKDGDHRRSTSSIAKDLNCSSTSNQIKAKSSIDKVQAARRIYEALMLNAWRKRKEDGGDLLKMIHKVTSELDRYKMKLHLLKSVLNTEMDKNGYAIKEIAKLKSTLRDYEKIINAMKEEIREKERMIMELEDMVSHERMYRSNTKNELIQSQIEESALREQLAKEREKLKKLRDDMEQALFRVEELEEALGVKNNWIHMMNETIQKEKEVQASIGEKLEDEKSRNKELLDENKRLTRVIDDLEEVKRNFEAEVLRNNEEAKAREERMSALEKDLQTHKTQLTNSKTLLAEILHERRQLEVISTRESGYVVLAKNIISGVGRLPLALFNSITYALWPFEAYSRVQRSTLYH